MKFFHYILIVSLSIALLAAAAEGRKRDRNRGKKDASKKGKQRLRHARRLSGLTRGSVQGVAPGLEGALVRCQFLERNYGEGAHGLLIRRCKIKRPNKQKIAVTCEYGDFLCQSCDASTCLRYNQNRKIFLHELAKKAVTGIKRDDDRPKEYSCGTLNITYSEESCALVLPLAAGSMTEVTKKIRPTTAKPTTTSSPNPDCVDSDTFLCNAFSSWGDFFNKPFYD